MLLGYRSLRICALVAPCLHRKLLAANVTVFAAGTTKQARLVRRGDDGPNVDLCGLPLGIGAILWPPFVPPPVSVIVHGSTFCFCFGPKEDWGRAHSRCARFVGDEGKSALCYSGSLFNHVPSASQARLMKQERTVFARRNSKSSGKSVEVKRRMTALAFVAD